MTKETHSVTGRRGLTVAPSPFNEVKLDLGVILAVGLVLLFVQSRALDSLLAQFLALGSYGLLGMLWIVVRTRCILARLAREREASTHGPE